MKPMMKKTLALLSLSTMLTTGATYAATTEAAVPDMNTIQIQPEKTVFEASVSIQGTDGAISGTGFWKTNATEPMIPLRAVTENKILNGTITSKGNSVAISMKDQAKRMQSTGVITSIRTTGDNAQIHIQDTGTGGIVLNVGPKRPTK